MSCSGAFRKEDTLSARGYAVGVLFVALLLIIILQYLEKPIFVIIGTVVLFAGVIFCARPRLGIYLIIFSFPFLSTIPRGAYVRGLKLDEVLIILFFAIVFISSSDRKNYRLTHIDLVYLILFILGSLLPIMGAFIRGKSPAWIEAIALLKPIILYRVVVMSLSNRRQLSWALRLLLMSSLFVTVIAVFQLLNIGSVPSMLAQIYYDTSASVVLTGRVFRATSTLGNWNALGGYSALAALLCLSLLHSRGEKKLSLLVLIALGANISTLLLAGSSSSIIGFFVGLIVWLVARPRGLHILKRYRIYLFLAFLLVLSIFLTAGGTVIEKQILRQAQDYVYDFTTQSYYPTYGFPASVVLRWLLAVHLSQVMIQDGFAVITGFGAGSDAVALLPWGTPESGYMAMLFFYGVPFLLLYFFLLLTILLVSHKIRARLDQKDDLGLSLTTAVISSTIALGFMNIIHSYYSAAGVTHYFWIMVACMVALTKMHFRDPKTDSTEAIAGV